MRLHLIATQRFLVHALWILFIGGLTVVAWQQTAAGQETATGQETAEEQTAEKQVGGKRVAVIIVGLPGDKAHETLFEQTSSAWTHWLLERCQFKQSDIHLFVGREVGDDIRRFPATRKSIKQRITALKATLGKEDRIWVFFLGHANDANQHTFFHLPGPDMDEREVGELFLRIPCHEQVFWLTHACSGNFLKSLSQPSRIVISATVAGTEINETEFPQALAIVAKQESQLLDANKDGRISVREVFGATVNQVESIFKSDKRVPTEHASLDDNGDGKGTELPELAQTLSESETGSEQSSSGDGLLSGQTFLPAVKTDLNTKPKDVPK